jgi:hypothetical protein
MRALNVAPRPVVSASTFTTSFTGGDIENPDYFPSMMVGSTLFPCRVSAGSLNVLDVRLSLG